MHMDSLARLLIRLARTVPGCAVVAVHHAGQDAARGGEDDHMLGRGSTALNAAARAVITVRKPTRVEAAALESEGYWPSAWRAVRGPKVSRSAELPVSWVILDGQGVPKFSANPPEPLEQVAQARRAKAAGVRLSRKTSGDPPALTQQEQKAVNTLLDIKGSSQGGAPS
jgi:hypothetical protein